MTKPAPTTSFNLELFFELSADLLCIAGYDGYFKKINPTVSKTLGYTDKELFAKPINTFVHPDDQHITEQNRDNLRNDNPLLNFENRYLTKSGEIVWLSWTSMPINSEKLVFAIAKNITHKKKLEEDRNQLLTDLTKINTDLKQLTYTTSHDLRLPVSNLLSVFSFLDISKINDRETLQFIRMLRSATETLKDVLNNYVDALTHESGLNIQAEEIDLPECFDVVLNALGALIQGAKANINADFTAFTFVKFNKVYMESMLLNLVTNAVKYAKPGQAPVIYISTKIKDGRKQMIFADEGLGFDMDKVKDRIFGINQKFHDHADSKGIGLYLVHSHVVRMGGQIEVASKVNNGTTFTITFAD
jgi:PAS domain S-box-containing protein